MAHPEQQNFCLSVKEQHPEFFHGTRVIECGSRNVNGSLRVFFEECDYTGIDCMEGDGVDVVSLIHEYNSEELFDVVCSAEALEHDPFLEDSISNMVALLRQGGLLFITCAGEGRGEHGTTASGEVWGPDSNYYKNVSLTKLVRLVSASLVRLYIEYNEGPKDVYLWGIKK